MTTKEFVRLEKRLLPDLPEFTIRGRLMFIPPAAHILRGICFEPSAFDKKSFYVNVFVLPLCVPTQHLYFNFGKRVGTEWNADAPDVFSKVGSALKREALPFLSRVESLHDFVELAMSFSLQNPHTPEAIAYAWARAGNVALATEELERLVRLLDAKIPWQRAMAERAETLKAKLLADPVEAQRQLEAWENESAKNLGLEKFR